MAGYKRHLNQHMGRTNLVDFDQALQPTASGYLHPGALPGVETSEAFISSGVADYAPKQLELLPPLLYAPSKRDEQPTGELEIGKETAALQVDSSLSGLLKLDACTGSNFFDQFQVNTSS